VKTSYSSHVVFAHEFSLRKTTLRILIIAAILALAGCSQAPKKTPADTTTTATASTAKDQPKKLEQNSKQRQEQLASLNHWQAKGRLAAAHGQKGGNASFVWEQKGDSYQIKLFGPFGSGAVYIIGHPQYVELKEANGKTTRAQNPEQLLKKLAGWQIPLTGLRHWMRGIPAPGAIASQKLDTRGYLSHLNQQGWNIQYENYFADKSPALPGKLQLQNGNVKLKMIITSWQNS